MNIVGEDRSVGKIIMTLGWRGAAATTIIIIIMSMQKQPLSMMPLTMTTEAVVINNS